jgi:hypothetical protein
VRIAVVGSMRTARAAGIEQAINATSATARATVANMTGSRAGTSKSSVVMSLVPANAPIRPVSRHFLIAQLPMMLVGRSTSMKKATSSLYITLWSNC